MHPAKSVIYFTTATGAGYGLLFWLAAFAWMGVLPAERVFGFVAFGLAYLLVVSGLMSSTLHLGHPERAWRALSQWRSSWLSREGLVALLTFGPTGLFAMSWVLLEENTGPVGLIGLVGALMSVITVFCTAMIYVSLKAIPAWNNRWVTQGYLLLSFATGAVLLAFLFAAWGYPGLDKVLVPALVFIGLGLLLKVTYWASRRSGRSQSSAATATGLGAGTTVRMIEGPHTEANYLLEEMGFQIARKHASKLRYVAIVLGFLVPAIALVGALLVEGVSPLVWLVPAVLSCTVGIATERWLFFAEAKHVVMLYYGRNHA